MGQQRSLWIVLKGGLSGSDMRPRGLKARGGVVLNTLIRLCAVNAAWSYRESKAENDGYIFFLKTFKTDVKFLQRSRRQKKKKKKVKHLRHRQRSQGHTNSCRHPRSCT